MSRNVPTGTTSNPSKAEIQAANATAEALRQAQQSQAHAITAHAPIQEHEIGPAELAAMNATPVVHNALEVPPLRAVHPSTQVVMKGADESEVPKLRVYRVEKDHPILDRTSGSRTKLRAGKEITSAHYDIRDLQRQGAPLKDITDRDENAPL